MAVMQEVQDLVATGLDLDAAWDPSAVEVPSALAFHAALAVVALLGALGEVLPADMASAGTETGAAGDAG